MTVPETKHTLTPVSDLLPAIKPRESLTALLQTLAHIDSHTLPPSTQHHAAQTMINASRALIEEAKRIMGAAWVAMDGDTKRTFELGTEYDPRYPLLEPMPRKAGAAGGLLQSPGEFPPLGEGFMNAWAAVSPVFRGFDWTATETEVGGGGRWTGEGKEWWREMRMMAVEERKGGRKKREVVVEQEGKRMEVVLREWVDETMVKEQRHVGEEGGEWNHGSLAGEMDAGVQEVLSHNGDKNVGFRGSW